MKDKARPTHYFLHGIRRALEGLLLCAFTVTLSNCVTEDTFDNNNKGNFEALWRIIDEHYCFLDDKNKTYGLDWDAIHAQYSNRITESMKPEQLFEVCGDMLRELQDGHVNLTASFNTARYWDWFERYPVNFSDSIQRKYLGTDYLYTQGIKYKILPCNIGYVYCPSFEYSFGSGNLSAIFSHLAVCTGLILDIRNNSGGQLTSAQALAECFINEKTTGGYICHKTGKGHSSFSSPEAITLTPAEGIRWQKPVIVLTNRNCYSAANTFVMYMKACTNATILGARTGGGCGIPFNSELPNGWLVRFSAVPMYDINMQLTESGIDPDIHVDITTSDWQNSTDTMIEEAIKRLTATGQ